MSKMKNWMMDIQEFCDGYFYGVETCTIWGEADFTIDEVVEDVGRKFRSLEAKSYAKRYLEKSFGEDDLTTGREPPF